MREASAYEGRWECRGRRGVSSSWGSRRRGDGRRDVDGTSDEPSDVGSPGNTTAVGDVSCVMGIACRLTATATSPSSFFSGGNNIF